MPRALWEKILRELGGKKMTSSVMFHLTGEPLMHREVLDAIRFANTQGLSVSLYTNGAMLDEKTSEKLLDALRVGRVVLSLQSTDQSAFPARSRQSLSWDEYASRLRRFAVKAEEAGRNVQVHVLADIGTLGWNVAAIRRERARIQAIYDEWRLAMGQTGKHRINILDPSRSYPLGRTVSFFVKHKGTWDNRHIGDDMEAIRTDHGHCAMMTDTFAVLADGTCTYCCCDYEGELNLGDAHTSSLEDIYYGSKATAIRLAGKENRLIEDRCRLCRGALIYKKTGKMVRVRNPFTDYYLYISHAGQYGVRSALAKVMENLRRRIAHLCRS